MCSEMAQTMGSGLTAHAWILLGFFSCKISRRVILLLKLECYLIPGTAPFSLEVLSLDQQWGLNPVFPVSSFHSRSRLLREMKRGDLCCVSFVKEGILS